MPEDLNKRAAEINEAVKKADAKRRVDAEPDDGALAKVLEVVKNVSDRMDAMEAARNDQARRDDDESSEEPMLTEKERQAGLTQAQMRADAAATARGERAPPPLSGEGLMAYRRRLLRDFKNDSKEFGHLDLSTLSGPAFDAVEQRIYADATAAAANPFVPGGELIERVHVDARTGARRVDFFGDPSVWLDQFKQRPMRAKFIRPKDR